MDHQKFKVAFFDAKPYDRAFFEPANRQYNFSITFFDARLCRETASLAAGFDAVCIFVNDDLDEAAVDLLARNGVRLIALRCAGYNNVNVKAACERGIPVVRVPQYSPYAVAEYALGLLMTLNRRIHRAYTRVREGNFAISGLMGFDLHGKTAGIVGTGKIGRTFAELLQGFRVRLLAYDPFPDAEAAKTLHLEYVPAETLFRESDVISLHCPLTPENTHLVSAQTLAMMKPGSILINTSRGKLIDSAALAEALKSGPIGGAGLDVYEEETDYFFEDHSDQAIRDDVLARLMTFPNVIITSHQAFFTREAETNIAAATMENLAAFADGKELVNAVCRKCQCRKNCPGKEPGTVCTPSPELHDRVAGKSRDSLAGKA